MESDLLMPRGSSASALLPFSSGSMSMDVKETETGYTMAVEVPGMSKDNINISVDEARSTVTITSERKAEKEDKQEGWLLRERSYGKSQRSVLLPETADLNKAEVELKVLLVGGHTPCACKRIKRKSFIPVAVRVAKLEDTGSATICN
eukprot:8256-Heterococcus_DN1.PRE.1